MLLKFPIEKWPEFSLSILLYSVLFFLLMWRAQGKYNSVLFPRRNLCYTVILFIRTLQTIFHSMFAFLSMVRSRGWVRSAEIINLLLSSFHIESIHKHFVLGNVRTSSTRVSLHWLQGWLLWRLRLANNIFLLSANINESTSFPIVCELVE